MDKAVSLRTLSVPVLEQVIGYLSTCPYSEVAAYIAALRGFRPLPERLRAVRERLCLSVEDCVQLVKMTFDDMGGLTVAAWQEWEQGTGRQVPRVLTFLAVEWNAPELLLESC